MTEQANFICNRLTTRNRIALGKGDVGLLCRTHNGALFGGGNIAIHIDAGTILNGYGESGHTRLEWRGVISIETIGKPPQNGLYIVNAGLFSQRDIQCDSVITGGYVANLADNLGCAIDDIVAIKRDRRATADTTDKQQVFTSHRRSQFSLHRTTREDRRVNVTDQCLGSD